MYILKPLCLIILGSLLFNANYAQCPDGETEITIQFIEYGNYPSEVVWDYKIQGVLSGSGPYGISEIINTCVPEGDLTIVGCDTAGDTWNGAIFQVALSQDTTINACSTQSSCYIYTSSIEDASKVLDCYSNPEYEVITLSIGSCKETSVITSGCIDSEAINYNACAVTDDGSCRLPTENNDCSNAKFIDVSTVDNYFYEPDTLFITNNSVNIQPNCDSANQDAFYRFVVPPAGKIQFISNQYVGISLFNACSENSMFCDFTYNNFIDIDSLTAGDTLILQIFKNTEAYSNIIFNLEEAAPASNNTCENAQLIDISPTGECSSNEIELNLKYHTTDISPSCNSYIVADAFYEITVPTTGIINISSSAEVGIALYSYCDGTELFCSPYVRNEIIRDLEPGDNLKLQFFTSYNLSNFSFCVEEVFPSENNNCKDAQTITVAETGSCEMNVINLPNFYYNTADIEPQCDEQILYDVFYKFIVPSSGYVLFASNNNVGISVYNSCDSSSLFCDDRLDYVVLGDLPIGDTLILQIFEDYYNIDDFSFCLEEVAPSDNNNCINAQTITVAETGNCEMYQVNVSNLSYNTPNNQPDCASQILYDAYYKFVVPQSGQVLFSASDYVGIAVYNACNSSSIFCNDYNSYFIIRDLPIGDTLILQIFENSFQSDFSFCLEDAAPTINNDCTNALPITVSQSGNCEMNQVNLPNLHYNTQDVQTECRDSSFPDAFFEFIVPPSGNLFFSSNQYLSASILNACNGASLLCLESISNEIVRNLPAGKTVTLQIFPYFFEPEISFCLEEVTPSNNNNCIDALPITVAQSGDCQMHQVNLSNFNYNSYNIKPACESNILIDAFYEFIVPPSGQIKISADYNPGVAIYNSCDGANLYCNNYIQNNIIRNLPIGDLVILQVFDDSNRSDISFCVEEVAPSINNNCVDAAPITIAESGNCETHQVTLENFNYNSANIKPACSDNISYDAFYQLEVPETGQIKFSSSNAVGVAVYQLCNSSSLFCEEYTQDETIRNLPAGETIILQIFDYYNNSDFTFCLEESIPIANNICINAEPFVVNEPGNCEGNYIQVPNTSNNTDINPYCASYVKADAFYSFIVPASGHIAISTSNEVGISIYDDCLEQSFYCNNSFQNEIIYGLNPSDTLILQAFQTKNPSNFDLCIEDAPPSNNNLCENAETLQVYEEGSCEGNFISAPIKNNSVSINPSCQYIAADIFYKITVPESGQIRIQTDVYGIGLSVYTTCDTTAIFCASEISDQLVQGLPVNEEVLLQFFDYYEKPNDFNLCIDDALPTANNDCSNAISVDVAASNAIFETNYTLDFQNNSANIRPICQSINQDAFYKFIVPENGRVIIGVSNGLGIALYNTCDGESIFCQSYIDDFAIISDLPPGEELILQIFNVNSYYEVQFSVSETINNTTCEKASILCEPTVSSTNAGATQEIYRNEFICNFNNNNLYNTVWYSFTADNSGSPVSFKIDKSYCSKSHNDLEAIILSNSCGDEYIVEDCINVSNWNNDDTLSIKNPVPYQVYYLVIGSEYYSDFCNFEINVLEGIEMDCCQLDYTLNTWCYYLNPNNYFVDVTINNFGQNPTGYRLTETGQEITTSSTTRIGPIPNGINNLTLEGLDMQDCTITETINFDCSECTEHLNHTNASINRSYKFNASKTIESDIKVMPATSIKYFAGDSITLKQGFTVEKGAGFSIDIEDCE